MYPTGKKTTLSAQSPLQLLLHSVCKIHHCVNHQSYRFTVFVKLVRLFGLPHIVAFTGVAQGYIIFTEV